MTWTVLGADHAVSGPAEEFLEFLRVQASSPNTVKSYARALALWWSYLQLFGLAWDKLSVAEVGGFLAWLRSGDSPRVSSIQAAAGQVRRGDDRHQTARGDVVVPVPRAERGAAGRGPGTGSPTANGSRYKPMLEHVARRRGRRRAMVTVAPAVVGSRRRC